MYSLKKNACALLVLLSLPSATRADDCESKVSRLREGAAAAMGITYAGATRNIGVRDLKLWQSLTAIFQEEAAIAEEIRLWRSVARFSEQRMAELDRLKASGAKEFSRVNHLPAKNAVVPLDSKFGLDQFDREIRHLRTEATWARGRIAELEETRRPLRGFTTQFAKTKLAEQVTETAGTRHLPTALDAHARLSDELRTFQGVVKLKTARIEELKRLASSGAKSFRRVNYLPNEGLTVPMDDEFSLSELDDELRYLEGEISFAKTRIAEIRKRLRPLSALIARFGASALGKQALAMGGKAAKALGVAAIAAELVPTNEAEAATTEGLDLALWNPRLCDQAASDPELRHAIDRFHAGAVKIALRSQADLARERTVAGRDATKVLTSSGIPAANARSATPAK